MKLLTIIDSGRAGMDPEQRKEASERRVAYNDRWDRLSAFRCNPSVHIRASAQALDEPIPFPKGKEEKVDEFTGLKSTSYRLSGFGLGDLLPAFSFVSLLENVGFPLRVGNTTIYSDDVVRAAEWVIPASPNLALSLVLRMASQKKGLQLFDRVRIALFSKEEASKFIDRIEGAIKFVLDEWDSADSKAGWGWKNELRFEVKLLERLSIRTPEDRTSRLFETAISLFEELGQRDPIGFVKPVVGILENLFRVCPPEQAASLLVKLADLPLPTDFGLTKDVGPQWRDPLLSAVYIVGPDRLSRQISPSKETRRVAHGLATEAKFGNQYDRRVAIQRLAALHRVDSLGEESKRAFVDALWAHTSDDSQLPKDTGLNYRGLLRLPEPEEGITRERIRNHLKSQAFPRATTQGEVQEGEQPGTSRPGPVPSFLNSWIQATHFPGSEQEDMAVTLEWSPEVASDLLKGAREWWKDEQAGLDLSQYQFLGSDHFEDLFRGLEDLLWAVILPYVGESDNETIKEAKRLLEEMRERDVPTLIAEVELTRLDSSAVAQLRRNIRRSLVSTAENQVEDAARSLSHWIVQAKRGRLPEPDQSLAELLTERLLTARLDRVKPILKGVEDLADDAPGVLTETALTDLVEGLDRLAEETDFPSEPERLQYADSENLLYILPKIRASAASLAHSVSQSIDEGQIPNREDLVSVVDRWQELATDSSLPEIRNSWKVSGK